MFDCMLCIVYLRVFRWLAKLDAPRLERLQWLVTSRLHNKRTACGVDRAVHLVLWQVARVKKLRPRDAARILVDNVPKRFTKKELGLKSDCTVDDILGALGSHPVLQAADGHPGTLVRDPGVVCLGNVAGAYSMR